MAIELITKRSIPLLGCASVLTLSAVISSTNVHAASFSIGEIKGSINSQVSVGTSVRVEDQDQRLISVGNGGVGPSNTADDANLNFEKGDAFSTIFKGSHDLELTYKNFGAFFRAKYWYDFELKEGERPHGHVSNGYARDERLDDSEFDDLAKFSGVELLDAFLYASFDIGNMPTELRAGSQVVSWGESTFVRGSINSINPVDVSAFRRPGAEIKEGLLPVPMVFGQIGITDNLSVEAFYQLEFEKTVIDGCGTLFATVDWAATGCNALAFVASQPDIVNLAIPGAAGIRTEDVDPDDKGQYGIATRYFVESLDTEFGLYYLNYHSRTPFVSAPRTSTNYPAQANPLTRLIADPTYYITFPEDIELFGVSAATNLGNWAISGEISHRPEQPVQLNGNDTLSTGLTDGFSPTSPLNAWLRGFELGERINAFDRLPVTQAQLTAIGFFDQVLGASRITLIAEIGATAVDDLEDDRRYGRNSTFGSAAPGVTDGFVTDNAWGYRLRSSFEYPNAVFGLDFKPVVSFSHDVDGYSPNSVSGFIEDAKALGVALNFEYIQKYNFGLSFNRFFGGEYNPIRDRDFVSANFAVSF